MLEFVADPESIQKYFAAHKKTHYCSHFIKGLYGHVWATDGWWMLFCTWLTCYSNKLTLLTKSFIIQRSQFTVQAFIQVYGSKAVSAWWCLWFA